MADSKTVEFELVTPQRLMLSEAVAMVVIPGGEGDFGVLPGHAPLISTVRPGTVNIYENDTVTQSLFVSGGFAEVKDNRCTLLAEEAVAVSEIDRAAAEKRLAEANESLEAAEEDSPEAKKAEADIKVAEAMIAAAGKGK